MNAPSSIAYSRITYSGAAVNRIRYAFSPPASAGSATFAPEISVGEADNQRLQAAHKQLSHLLTA